MPVVVVVAAIAAAGMLDLPRSLTLGPTTGCALDHGSGCRARHARRTEPVRAFVRPREAADVGFLWAFVGWALLSMVWFRPSFAGVQNTLVYASFAGVIPVTAAAVIRGDLSMRVARAAISGAILLACVFELGNLVVGGVGSDAVVGARSFALVGVVGVGWGVAHARFGQQRVALAGAVVLPAGPMFQPLAHGLCGVSRRRGTREFLDFRNAARFFRSVLIIGTIGVIAYVCVTSFGPLASRFQAQGDLQTVGSVAVNLEGRSNLWRITWDSYVKSPIIGQGAGSSEVAIAQVLGRSSHPHDDYLRVLHDFGIDGLGPLAAALAAILTHSVRAAGRVRRDDPAAPVHYSRLPCPSWDCSSRCRPTTPSSTCSSLPVGVIVGLSIGAAQPTRSPEPPPDGAGWRVKLDGRARLADSSSTAAARRLLTRATRRTVKVGAMPALAGARRLGLMGLPSGAIRAEEIVDPEATRSELRWSRTELAEPARRLRPLGVGDECPATQPVTTTVTVLDGDAGSFAFCNNLVIDERRRVVLAWDADDDGTPYRFRDLRASWTPLEKPHRVSGSVAYLSNTGAQNFGHWFLFVYPLIRYYRDYLGGDPDHYYLGASVAE